MPPRSLRNDRNVLATASEPSGAAAAGARTTGLALGPLVVAGGLGVVTTVGRTATDVVVAIAEVAPDEGATHAERISVAVMPALVLKVTTGCYSRVYPRPSIYLW
jgi:hypothetical protein